MDLLIHMFNLSYALALFENPMAAVLIAIIFETAALLIGICLL